MPGPGLRSSPNAACWSNRRHVSGARAENLKGSMKLKRLISLLLLAIYLTAWGGPAYVSLSCKCVTMSSHVCCHHCQHSADAAGAGESLRCAHPAAATTIRPKSNSIRVLLPITTRDSSAARSPTCRPHWLRRLRSRPSSSSSGRRFPNAAILSSCGAMCAPQAFVPLPYWLKTFLGRMLRASARK